MRRLLAIFIRLGGLVRAAACTAPPEAGLPAGHGGASAGPGSAGTAGAAADARTRRGHATVRPGRS